MYSFNQSSTYFNKLLSVGNINKMHKCSIQVCNLDNTMDNGFLVVWVDV